MNAFCANTHMFFSRRKVYIAILQHLTSLAHLLYLLCKENNTMLNHYFKIATRNLLKYKLQSVISIRTSSRIYLFCFGGTVDTV